MNLYKSCAFHLMQKAMWYEYYSSNTNFKPTWHFFGRKPRWFNQTRKQLITTQCIEHRYLPELTVSVNKGNSNGYIKRRS
jgi:hypothetical protein